MSGQLKKGSFIERLILLKNLSHKSYNEIEKDLKYPRNALQNYRNGGEPSAKRLIELANYFEVTPNYLIGESDLSSVDSVEAVFQKFDFNQKREMAVLCQKWLLTSCELSSRNHKNSRI